MSTKRLFFIDNLRTILTILVIMFHLAITYGAPIGDWQYKEGEPGAIESIFFITFIAVTQSFFMGFFFLISGYFTPGSFYRKGAGPFLRDRLLRLGTPLLFYVVFIDPAIEYALALSRGFTGSILIFLGLYVGNYRGLGSGPLWFVEALLIFAIFYALWRRIVKGTGTKSPVPRNSTITFFAITLGVITFVVRIWLPIGWNFRLLNLQLPFFPQYIALFATGIVAYKGDWFTQVSNETGRLWSWVTIVLVALFPILLLLGSPDGDPTRFAGGLYWQAFAIALWEQLIGIAIIISLTVFFREKYNSQGRLAKAMSESAYTVYIIHAPLIILIALYLRSVKMPLLPKWVLVTALAVPLCFVLSNFIKKLPIARRVL